MIYFIFIITLASCETTIENQDIPYKEQLVIKCILKAGEKLSHVEITKTLPPLEEYDYEKAKVKNASAAIYHEGEEYLLHYDPNNETYYNYDLIPEIGGKYKLVVNWNGHRAEGETYIPEPVEIKSFYVEIVEETDDYWYEFNEGILYAVFYPNEKSAYAGYILMGDNDKNKYYTDYSYKTRDTSKSGVIELPVSDFYYYDDQDTNELKKSLEGRIACVECYDEDFHDYFLTRYEGGSENAIFSTSGINVKGNIKGGIGVFFGVSTAKRTVEF